MFKSIPVGWSRVPLSSLGERVRRRNTTDNTNVLTISAVHGLVNQKTFFKKIVASANLSNYFLLKKGEFAYNKSYSNGYPVGVVKRLDKYGSGVLSPLYICFDMSSDKVDQDYAVHFFDSQWFIYEINDIAKEGARNHGLLNVGVGDFFDLSFVLPPLPEQQKIATILSSVDDVIEKTRAQIDKLKDLKTGMMQELFTKGIGHTDFKDSPVGRIPDEWSVCTIAEIAKLTSGGTPSRERSEYWNGDIPWVKTGEINYQTIFNTEEKITKLGLKESSAKIVPAGAVLMAMYGQGITRGKVAKLGVAASMNQACLAMIPSDRVSDDFLYYFLTREYINLRLLVQEGTQKNLSAGIIKELLIPVPPKHEQKNIVEILQSIDNRTQLVTDSLNCKLKIKKALMQDLLTGKVRVKLTDKESAAS